MPSQSEDQSRELLTRLREAPEEDALEILEALRGGAIRGAAVAIMMRNFSHGVGQAIMAKIAGH